MEFVTSAIIFGVSFLAGMFVTDFYKKHHKKPLNYKQMHDLILRDNVYSKEVACNAHGLKTKEVVETFKERNFNDLYEINFIDQYGHKHPITLAQFETGAMDCTYLALYALNSKDYDDKGNYKG